VEQVKQATEGFDRRRHRFPENRYFEDLAVGERFYIPSRTVTETNFAAFQTVSADNHPIHYDVEYCRERGHPGPPGARLSGAVLHRRRRLADDMREGAGAGVGPEPIIDCDL
jgi:acyl dehydratase